MDDLKLQLIKSILRFLREESEHGSLDAEQKESLDVARQCLESTYEIDSQDTSGTNVVDLNVLFRGQFEISEETKKMAEDLKVKGNDQMKIGAYAAALDLYTKAINLNPKNPVYYSNRAAAHSRLGKHWDAIADCKESIKLSPSAKAYGRMGVAYSHMNLYQEAKEAYAKAHELDPTNPTYEQNLRLSEDILVMNRAVPSGTPTPPGLDLNSFMNNPALVNLATHMLNDPAFRNMVSGIMSSGPNGDPNIDAFVTVGQQLAQQMQTAYPNVMEALRVTSMNQGRGQDPDDQNQDPPNSTNN